MPTAARRPDAHRRDRRRSAGLGALLALAGLLGACGSVPPGAATGAPAPRPPTVASPSPPADTGRDGALPNPPPDLLLVPDAEPRLETVRSGGPNKPYAVLGQTYVPLAGDPPLVERGLASWYGRKFHGRNTASGETYNMYAMTAAHKTMPLPSYARVRNPANGREVLVRINDRGPFHSDRVIDLSYTAALKLGLLGGTAVVEVERITYEAIRTGAWRAPVGGDSGARALAQASPATAVAELDTDPIAEIVQRSSQRWAAQTGQAAPAVLPVVSPAGTGPAPGDAALPAEATAPARAAAKAAPGFWLQLGAFAQREGAVGFQDRVAREAGWLAPLMAIFNDQRLHRLQAGPYASRADARHAADRLRAALQLVPAIVERR